MKVFISWSGERSKTTANILSSWIRQVIQAAETWVSLDIEKGTRWNDQINKELENTKVGIICLNKENLTSEWILFEAGALSKTQDAHVCTFLLDINPADVKPPLGQFQHTTFNKEDVKKLLQTINTKIISIGEKTLTEKDLEEVFENSWSRMEVRLSELISQSTDIVIRRTERDILEEILQTVRTSKEPNFNEAFEKYIVPSMQFNKYLMDSIWNRDSPVFNYLTKLSFEKKKEDNANPVEPKTKNDENNPNV